MRVVERLQPPLPGPLPQGEREKKDNSSPLAGEEGARARQRVGRRGGQRDLLKLAKRMRKEPTEAERRLWSALRGGHLTGWKFKRQEQLGEYVVDFVCFGARLIVEADGSQLCESAADARRDAWLTAQGFRVLRFWNNDILNNTDGVAVAVPAALEIPLPNPSPVKGEGLVCSSPLAGEEGARARQRVGRRGAK